MQSQSRILIVDDEAVSLTILEELLSPHYALRTAGSGEEALELAREFQPDLVLLDLMMPGIGGYETCRQIRADEGLRFCKILLVSAKQELQDRLEGYGAGADDFITKPYDRAELLAKVKVLTRLSDVEQIDQLKSRFLNLLAHETRTPLTGLIGPAQLLADDIALDDEDRREMAHLILDNARSLQEVVDKAVLLCAFQVGEAVVEHETLDLAQLSRDVVAKVLENRDEDPQAIRIDVKASASVHGDDEHLRFALASLLETALNHRRSDAPVSLELALEEDMVKMAVGYGGTALSMEQLLTMFDGFESEDVDHHTGSLQLDLALSREIVWEHEGEFTVAVEENGHTVFRLELPHAVIPAAERQLETV